VTPTRLVRHFLRLLIPLALAVGVLSAAAPAHATHYCVGVDVDPNTGAYVCTP
jgi:hypothetical protein